VTSVSTQAIVRGILSDVPKKYQNPKLQIRRDVERPFYFIRYSARGKRRVQLIGFVDEMPAKEANKRRAAFLEVVNAGRLLIQADLKFRQVCEQFLAVRVPQLAFATRNNYQSYISNHVLPAFGEMKLCDIDGAVVESVNPGYCFKMAGWKFVRTSKDGKLHLLTKELESPTRGDSRAMRDEQEPSSESPTRPVKGKVK